MRGRVVPRSSFPCGAGGLERLWVFRQESKELAGPGPPLELARHPSLLRPDHSPRTPKTPCLGSRDAQATGFLRSVLPVSGGLPFCSPPPS